MFILHTNNILEPQGRYIHFISNLQFHSRLNQTVFSFFTAHSSQQVFHTAHRLTKRTLRSEKKNIQPDATVQFPLSISVSLPSPSLDACRTSCLERKETAHKLKCWMTKAAPSTIWVLLLFSRARGVG
jgi:hypothetical protein